MEETKKFRYGDFKQGDIVYWCHHAGNADYSVHWGMVDDQYPDCVMVDYLVPKERRLVDGVPLENFESEQRYRKLPKNWTYNTELFKITYRKFPEYLGDVNFEDPKNIKKLYDDGWLVKKNTIDQCTIESEITKEGFRVVKKYPMWHHEINDVSIRPDKLYFTYKEAEKEVMENRKEFERQASLSDLEWSKEQIYKRLKHYQKITDCSDAEIEGIFQWLCSLDKVEDIEVRIFNMEVQWKRWKEKRWKNIEV